MTTEASYDEKVCGRCNELKDRSEFHHNASRKDGLAWECKACRHTYVYGNVPPAMNELGIKAANRKARETKIQSTIRDHGLAVAEILYHAEIRGR